MLSEASLHFPQWLQGYPHQCVLSLGILINQASLSVSVVFPFFPFSLREGVLGIEPRHAHTRTRRSILYLSTVAAPWAECLPKEGGLSSMQSSREQDGFCNSEIYPQRSVDFLFSCFQNIWCSFRTPCPTPALSPSQPTPSLVHLLTFRAHTLVCKVGLNQFPKFHPLSSCETFLSSGGAQWWFMSYMPAITCGYTSIY